MTQANEKIENYFTLRKAHLYLMDRGVTWSFEWLKMQVTLGKIPSSKILNSRAITREQLDKIVKEHVEK